MAVAQLRATLFKAIFSEQLMAKIAVIIKMAILHKLDLTILIFWDTLVSMHPLLEWVGSSNYMTKSDSSLGQMYAFDS